MFVPLDRVFSASDILSFWPTMSKVFCIIEIVSRINNIRHKIFKSRRWTHRITLTVFFVLTLGKHIRYDQFVQEHISNSGNVDA
jgi:hypothetical protein